MPEGSAIAIKLGEINYADNYTEAMQGLLRDFVTEKGLTPIYISITTPSSIVSKIFEAFDIKSEKIEFVDVVSSMMMSTSDEVSKNIIYVESPTMLEYVMLKTRYLIRKYTGKKIIVIIDSLNTLSIHNQYKTMIEFLHIFVNNLKSNGIYVVMLTMEGSEDKEKINDAINLVCEESITVREG
jgi:KaiC/GvpD/RAD55 family RecA-like ATPase